MYEEISETKVLICELQEKRSFQTKQPLTNRLLWDITLQWFCFSIDFFICIYRQYYIEFNKTQDYTNDKKCIHLIVKWELNDFFFLFQNPASNLYT